jgi:hypothetical protein
MTMRLYTHYEQHETRQDNALNKAIVRSSVLWKVIDVLKANTGCIKKR